MELAPAPASSLSMRLAANPRDDNVRPSTQPAGRRRGTIFSSPLYPKAAIDEFAFIAETFN
jgi:hypothetical protein